jgi:hypothetical protein
MASRILSPAQFRNWLKPAEALARLADLPSFSARQGWILRRLHHRQLRTCARTVAQGDREDIHFVILAPSDWRSWEPADDDEFWETGDYAGYATTQIGAGPDDYIAASFQAFDVRFDPALFDELDEEKRHKNARGWADLAESVRPGLEAALEKIQVVRTPAKDVEMSRDISRDISAGTIPQAEIDRWHAALTDNQKALSQRNLLAKAKADLGSGVKRKQIEHFTKGRPLGRKPEK